MYRENVHLKYYSDQIKSRSDTFKYGALLNGGSTPGECIKENFKQLIQSFENEKSSLC